MKAMPVAELRGQTAACDFNFCIHRISKSRVITNEAMRESFAFGAARHVDMVADEMARISRYFKSAVWVVDHPHLTQAKRFEQARRQRTGKRAAELLDGRQGAFKKLCADIGPSEQREHATLTPAHIEALGADIGAAVQGGQLSVEQAVDARQQELERKAFGASRVDSAFISAVRSALGARGVDSIVAPPGTEAEQLAACLQKTGQVDLVMTDDTDPLAFGATRLLCKYDGCGTFQCCSLPNVLQEMRLTMPEFVDFCILCGCDFTQATLPGVGPVTALKLMREFGSIEAILKGTQLDATQFGYVEARAQFALDVPYDLQLALTVVPDGDDELIATDDTADATGVVSPVGAEASSQTERVSSAETADELVAVATSGECVAAPNIPDAVVIETAHDSLLSADEPK